MQHKQATDQELIDEMAQLSGFIRRREEGAKSGITKVYMGDTELGRAYELLGLGKPEMAMIHMESVIDTWIPWLNSISRADLLTDEPPKLLTYLPLLREIAQRGVRYREKTLQENRDRFSKSWMFSPTELDDPKAFYPYLMMDIEEALRKRLFKMYQYQPGPDQITPEVPFLIYPNVGISYSLEAWFAFLKNQTDWLQHRQEAVLSLFLKLDPVSPHYASFVISIHYKGTIWLATDQLSFYNPQNRATSRNPQRHKESHYEHIGLPYEWVDELPKLRAEFGGLQRKTGTERIVRLAEAVKNQYPNLNFKRKEALLNIAQQILQEKNIAFSTVRSPKPNPGLTDSAEYSFFNNGMAVAQAMYEEGDSIVVTLIHFADILTVPVTRMNVAERIYLMMLCERLLEELMYQQPTDQLLLASQYLNQKLLEGASFDPVVPTEIPEAEPPTDARFTGWKGVHQERAKEIIASVGGESTALVRKQYDLVKTATQYDANWLATPNALEAMMKWTVLHDEATGIRRKIETLKDRHNQDWALMKDRLSQRLSHIITLALIEDPNMLLQEGYSHANFTDQPKPVSVNWLHWTPASGLNSRPGQQDLQAGRYWWMGLHLGYNQPYVRNGSAPKPVCTVCNTHKLDKKPKLIVEVRHYLQFMKLLGISDRMDLPLYFRNYKAHSFIPYHGNSILDNVHPYALLTDPCSEKEPNGILVNVYLCKSCLNKLIKEVGPTPVPAP